MEYKEKKILFFDPSGDMHEELQHFIIGQNFIVSVECDWTRALNWILLYQADLVVIFTVDPEQNGPEIFDCCSQLKQDEKTETIPVVFVTHRGRVNDIVSGFEVGADGFFIKPLDIEAFLPRIRQLIAGEKVEAAAAAAAAPQDLEVLFNEVIWKGVEPIVGHLILKLMAERIKKKFPSPVIQAIAVTDHGLDFALARSMAADDAAKKIELKQSFSEFTNVALAFLSQLTGNVLIDKIQKEMLKRLNQ